MTPADEAARYFHDGLKLAAGGCTREAISHFENATRLDAAQPAYHYNLGLAYHQARQFIEAIVAYEKALELAPEFFDAWFNLSHAARAAGQFDLGDRAARMAVGLSPQNPDAHLNLYESFKSKGDVSGAAAAHDQAVEAHIERMISLYHQRKLAQALEHAQAALRLAPDNPRSYNSVGVVWLAQNRTEDAIVYFRRAIDLKPELPASWTYLGHAYLQRQDLPEAIRCYETALASDPNFADARYFKAWAKLSDGSFDNAWLELERRWNAHGPRIPNCPLWNGEKLDGESLLIYAEHGFGDTLFFIRYAPLVANRRGRIVVECQPALRALLQTVEGIGAVVAHGETLPSFDLQVSLMSLPRIFQTTGWTIPNSVPYLHAPVTSQISLPVSSFARLKVGLAWAGSEMIILEQDRSLPLSELAPVWELANVSCYSLQVGPRSRQLVEVKGADRIVDLGPQLTDFAATAAAIEQMDLVISVDTAMAHLAGALAKPVWLLLVHCADWRWMLNRDDSPWYPTMRIFRQKKSGEDWAEVICRVRDALREALI